jgi:hypothetical protein
MKKDKQRIIKQVLSLCLTVLALTFTSCEQELNINDDPNNPTKVPLSSLLASSEAHLAYLLGGDGTRIPASIVQHYAGHRGQPLDYGQYNITAADSDGLWTELYDILIDLREIEDETKDTDNKTYLGISQVLQAYTFSVATDLFGDIPFSESLKGASNITPKYDKQEDIYNALLSMLDDGIANLNANAGASPGDNDMIYKGDNVKWIALANSIKLRLYNHLSKRTPTAALTFLQTNPSLIELSSNNAKINFGTVAANANPIHQFDILAGRADNAVCKTIVDKMKSVNDPRIPFFFNPVTNNDNGLAGQYLGNLPGNDSDDSGLNLYSRVGSRFASIDSPVILMSAAEVEFIKSEVYFRSSNNINAKASYEKAITNDFTDTGLTEAQAQTYILAVPYDNSLQRIMEQKWITMFQASYESFTDWRRTGFPELTVPTTNRTNGVTPRRLPYPQIEINVNGNSLSNGPGIPIPYETLKTKVWWDN